MSEGEEKRHKQISRPITPSGVPDVMDVREVSSYLGIGKSKIYMLIKTKKIPASKINRQYRFYKALIDKWLQEQVVTQNIETLPLFEGKHDAVSQ